MLLFCSYNQVLRAKETQKIKIVTSITPIAAIIAMLVNDDEATITSIASNKSCPHHYQPKPSDIQKINEADVLIYINPEFDGFAAKLMNKRNANIIKISDFLALNIINKNDSINWHFWLDLNNTTILLAEFAKALVKQFPEMRSTIYSNLDHANKQIKTLAEIKKTSLSHLLEAAIFSDSLEYFFIEYNIIKLYQSDQKSLHFIKNLQMMLNQSPNLCLILSSDQNIKLYQKFDITNIVQIESENWQTVKRMKTLFYDQYLKMIDQLVPCVNK
jgi:zinc transport system substrate-binding protein